MDSGPAFPATRAVFALLLLVVFDGHDLHEVRQLELIKRPVLDLAYSDYVDAHLPRITGGLTVVLGRTFKIVEPNLKNPQTRHWDLSFRIFELLL